MGCRKDFTTVDRRDQEKLTMHLSVVTIKSFSNYAGRIAVISCSDLRALLIGEEMSPGHGVQQNYLRIS